MEHNIPLIKASMPTYEEYCNRIKVIWDTRRMSDNGMLYNELKSELMQYLDVNGICLFSSGHSALECALQSLKTKGSVITTPYTFASTTQAILRTGNNPIFCDIDERSMAINPELIEDRITEDTVAILGVHTYGIPCDVTSIEKIAKKHNLYVLYDAAHCFGVKINGKGIGNYGDLSMFSMHSTKVFNSAEGGIVTYSNGDYDEKLRRLKYFGLLGREDADLIGSNGKLSEFHAALGLCNLKLVDDYIYNRKVATELYDALLDDCEYISKVEYPSNITRNYAYYPILIKRDKFINRDKIYSLLSKKGIETRKYFYPLTCYYSIFGKKYSELDFPIAHEISENILCLPLHSELTLEEVETVCKCIKDAIN